MVSEQIWYPPWRIFSAAFSRENIIFSHSLSFSLSNFSNLTFLRFLFLSYYFWFLFHYFPFLPNQSISLSIVLDFTCSIQFHVQFEILVRILDQSKFPVLESCNSVISFVPIHAVMILFPSHFVTVCDFVVISFRSFFPNY